MVTMINVMMPSGTVSAANEHESSSFGTTAKHEQRGTNEYRRTQGARQPIRALHDESILRRVWMIPPRREGHVPQACDSISRINVHEQPTAPKEARPALFDRELNQ